FVILLNTIYFIEVRRMKKQIISNAFLFLSIMVYVVLFKTIFGQSNLMVGVTVLIIGLVTSEKDMTQNLKLLFIKLLFILLYMGLASYLITVSAFLTMLISIPFIFFMTYWTTINGKKTYHFPYLLGYLFLLLSAPVSDIKMLPGRLISLAIGALLIVLLQYVMNKDTYKKILKNENETALELVEKRIDRILSQDYSIHPEEIDVLKLGMKRFMKVTFERRNLRTTLTTDSMYRVSEIISLHKIYYLLTDVSNYYEAGETSEELLLDLKLLVQGLKNEDYAIAAKIFDKWDEKVLPDFMQKIKQALKILKLSEQDVYPEYKENILHQIFQIDTKSLSFKFAMRVTILLSAALFYTTFFNLEYGRWLCFTLLALVQPSYEESNKKTWMRFTGTLFGVILFLILFTIFKSSTSRTLIVMITSYVNMFFNRYDYKMIATTIQSLGAAVIGTTGLIVAQNRVGFVLLGGIVAFLGNRYLFTIREKEAHTYLMDLYEKYKHYLLGNEKYPHTVIVEAYHALEMAGDDNKYREWLNVSFDALTNPIQ
ncbi:FUSC family protein, partial [Turicibacter sp. HGF1]|uniref:FUSC family protein n=2 Tax=Turicibacteraceae TaxID=2810281 RepID=UPI001EE66AD0